MKTNEDLASEIRSLVGRLEELEELTKMPANTRMIDELDSPSLVMKRLSVVQNLIDQIEIEIDKLEMRVSAIEHIGFRLRTGGR